MNERTAAWIVGALTVCLLPGAPLAVERDEITLAREPGEGQSACGSLEAGFPTSAAWPYHDDVRGPVQLVGTHAMYARLPRTWGEAVEVATVIAYARIATRSYAVKVDPYRGDEYVVSHYAAAVLEYIKPPPGDFPTGPTLDIVRNDGVMRRDGRSIVHYDSAFADYLPGCAYVLFLAWDAPHDAYYPVAGSHLTFLLDSERQQVLSRSTLLAGAAAETPLTFLALLRAVVQSSR